MGKRYPIGQLKPMHDGTGRYYDSKGNVFTAAEVGMTKKAPQQTHPSVTNPAPKNPYPVGSVQWRAWQLNPNKGTATKPSMKPKNGQTMVDSDGKTYIWNGTTWYPKGTDDPSKPSLVKNHPPYDHHYPDKPDPVAPPHQDTLEGMRAFLNKKGYNIPAGNVALLRSAAADWRGQRNPSLWRQQNVGGHSGKGAPAHTVSSGGQGSGTGKNGVTKIPALPNGNVNKTISQDVLDQGADPIPLSYANKVAGLQYDPQIFDTKQQIQRGPYDLNQHLHDISTWYGTVDKALTTAKERNATSAKDTTGQIGKVVQGILASMGGNAATGAGMVGAQGAADAATQAELGQNEQNYQNDLGPLLKSEGAGAKTNEQAHAETIAQDLAHQLESLKGQRGQLQGQTELDIRGQNNTTANTRLTNLLNILQYNNSARQQNLGNAQQAQALAQAAALNSAQVKYYNSSNKPTPSFIPWNKLSPAQRQSLVSAGIANVMDPNGGLMGNPQQARGKVLQYLSGQGYLNAAQPGTSPYTSMTSLIDLAIQHAQGIAAKNAAAAAAANG